MPSAHFHSADYVTSGRVELKLGIRDAIAAARDWRAWSRQILRNAVSLLTLPQYCLSALSSATSYALMPLSRLYRRRALMLEVEYLSARHRALKHFRRADE